MNLLPYNRTYEKIISGEIFGCGKTSSYISFYKKYGKIHNRVKNFEGIHLKKFSAINNLLFMIQMLKQRRPVYVLNGTIFSQEATAHYTLKNSY